MRFKTANRHRRRVERRDQRIIEQIMREAVFKVLDNIIGGMFDRLYGPGTAELIKAKGPYPVDREDIV
jgi:hypothetical protein